MKRNVSSRERLHDQNIGEKLNEDGEERKTEKIEKPKKNFGFKGVSLAIHTHESASVARAQVWKLNGFVDRAICI